MMLIVKSLRSTILAPLHLLGVALVLAISAPQPAAAATGEQIVARVRKEVAANPKNGPAILKNRLNELSVTERTKYAASAFAAAIEAPAGSYKGDDCDHIMRLYRAALAASPRSAVALFDVAYRACPSYLTAFRDAAVDAARAAGLPGVADAVLAQASLLGAGGASGTIALSPLGITINPANVGGPEGFEKEKKEKKPKKKDVSPSE